VIVFNELAEYLDESDDEFAELFASYLKRWVAEAGTQPPVAGAEPASARKSVKNRIAM